MNSDRVKNVVLYFPDNMPSDVNDLILDNGLPVPATFENSGMLFKELYLRISGSTLAMVHALDELNHRHVKTQQPLKCIIYFTSEPFVNAACAEAEGQHFIFIGINLIDQLAKCCVEMGKILPERWNKEDHHEIALSEKSLDILTGAHFILEEEKGLLERHVSKWPIPGLGVGNSADSNAIDEVTLFHDLIRLVIIHEFAHCACGHVKFFETKFGLNEMREFSDERNTTEVYEDLKIPVRHIYQAIEAHADSFSTQWSVGQIIVGNDPAGQLIGNVELGDRLRLLNIASALFGIQWALLDWRSKPGDTFRVNQDLLYDMRFGEEDKDVIQSFGRPFRVTNSGHPPALYRYFMHQAQVQTSALQLHSPQLMHSATVLTINFISKLKANPYFYGLLGVTPMVVSTPTMKTLDAYNHYLVYISQQMADSIHEYIHDWP